jgi:prepilin-type N-terminal cleavage/methylation domain-containing protein
VEAVMPVADERGFTLIETLVALFIMISAATLLYRGFASGLAAAATADAQQAALTVARSRLASLGPETPLEVGRTRGTEAGMSWTLDIAPYGPEDEDATKSPLRPMLVTATVTWRDRAGRAHRAALTTLKLREQHETPSFSQ